MKKSLLLLFVLYSFIASTQEEILELYKKGETPTYDQTIEFYKYLADEYSNAKLVEVGQSDYGKPIYVFLIYPNTKRYEIKDFSKETVILINNAIHPGEPCGVDACMSIAYNTLFEGKYAKSKYNCVLAIIPIYNVGGSHNRGAYSRANQVGPKEHGFRGNARNLDLNRDFIKADSKNAFTFMKIFQWLKPSLFIDTHTSNGADYQYTMTLITSQPDKMHPLLKEYTRNTLNPYIYKRMAEKEDTLTPYVNSVGRTPDTGIMDYLETPRYSTGYATLFNCISFVTEAHMLKTYQERVESTKNILYTLLSYAEVHHEEIKKLKDQADADTKTKNSFDLKWELDTTNYQDFVFRGFEYELIPSELTKEKRLKYYSDQPKNYNIKYYDHYKSTLNKVKPKYYLIPGQWEEVIYRLMVNEIEMQTIQKDTSIQVQGYYIDDYQTLNQPYEGHYMHHDIKVSSNQFSYEAKKGDLLIPTGTVNDYFLMSVLEPDAVDSYFVWNFFDEILGRKEYFSPYVFEEKAIDILERNPKLKKEYESKVNDFKNRWEALDYIYRNSEMYERTHNLYPVLRIE
ncbi:MAG: hypothetical protein R2799_01980 [Crocinitomicaceae bacterium]